MLARHLMLGEPLTFVGGKGGVGKTTVAAALAIELSDAGETVLVLSTDPAHSLGDALGTPLGPVPTPVPGVVRLTALEVDADHERRRFFASHGPAIETLIERGTYLESDDVREVTDQVLPGMDELAALLTVMRLGREFDGRVVVDTAPTGHTLRVLSLPELATGWLDALDAMEAKHAAVASALGGRYAGDAASADLSGLRAELAALAARLRDPAATRFVLVTNPEPVVLAETRRLRERLEEMGIAPGGVVVNRQREAPAAGATGRGMVFVPRLADAPTGLDGLRRLAASATPEPADFGPAGSEPHGGAPSVGDRFVPPLDRLLYVVGGKGGVGKSTVAAALAIRLAEEGERRTLLLSVDPAGSLGDVLDAVVDAAQMAVPGVPGLEARQLDAEGVWAGFRDRYQEEVEALFGSLLGSASATLDRRVIERLVDLAPPGIDELMALMEVIDLTEDRVYDALVLDTAPTGHLLRLLEMPDLALEWTHSIMRLLLKYQEVVSLGGIAERLLKLARELRGFRSMLRDESRSWVLAVALPEALSIPETGRLLERLSSMEIRVGALLVNRSIDEAGRAEAAGGALAQLIGASMAVPHVLAPSMVPAPRGADALRSFGEAWRVAQTR